MKVVVTGGAGFLGSHLVDQLVSEGYSVIVIDNLSSGRLEYIEKHLKDNTIEFVEADLLEPSKWINYFRGVDIVFHYAANPEVRHSVRDPLEHYHQNLSTTMNVLEAMRKYDVKILVFASSSTVYGDPEKIPTPEDHPIKPISVYGATKAMAEIMCQTYSRLYGLKTLILRYANIIGPRLRHGVIYDFINKLKKNPCELEILGDGTQKKSYLYVEDAVQATLKTLEYILSSDDYSLVFNVGNNDWISVREIADIVVESMKLDNVKYVFKPATRDGRGWLGDVKLMLLDITRLSRTIGWKPLFSSYEAVRKTTKALLKELGVE